MKHVMLDIESFGLAPHGAIASIGACRFDPKKMTVDRDGAFYVIVNLDDTPPEHVGTLTPSTIYWWMEQGVEAQKAPAPHRGIPLARALDLFAAWCKESKAKYLWSNGPTFDEVIIRSAWERVGNHPSTFPIHFRGSRCCRTHFWSAREHGYQPTKSHEDLGLVHHRADHDAIFQAYGVNEQAEFLRSLGL